jgi:hypothetical protein
MSIPFPSASGKVLQQAHGVGRHAFLGRAGAAGATIALAAGEFFLNGTETARVEQTDFDQDISNFILLLEPFTNVGEVFALRWPVFWFFSARAGQINGS